MTNIQMISKHNIGAFNEEENLVNNSSLECLPFLSIFEVFLYFYLCKKLLRCLPAVKSGSGGIITFYTLSQQCLSNVLSQEVMV